MTDNTSSASAIFLSALAEVPASSAAPQPAKPDLATKAEPAGMFNADQLEAIAQDMLNRGQITREEANAGLVADGASPLPDPAAQPLNSIAAQIDAEFPPARPEDYTMPRLTNGDAPYTSELQETDKMIRGWLSDARFPAGIGNFILKQAEQSAESWPRMSDTERTIANAKVGTQLAKMWGDATEQKLALGRQLIRELEAKTPGVIAMLENTGAGSNVAVIAQIVLHAERLQARRGK